MSRKLSIAVDDDIYECIERHGGQNRSAFIAAIIRDHKTLTLRQDLAAQYEKYAQETATIGDGLENLNPALGSETQKDRPCVILSSNLLNANLPRVAVAPLLKGNKPFHFIVNLAPDPDNALDQPRYIDLTQLRFVDKQRLRRQNGKITKLTVHQDLASAMELVFSAF